MAFKKLHPHIKEILEAQEKTTATAFQKASIPIIKSGTNVFCKAKLDSGKTTTLVITTLQKIKCEAMGIAPRAIVLAENNEKASEIYNHFFNYTRYTDMRLYFGDEKEHIDLLKSEIFEGIDILVATPKIVNKLLLLEGLNTTQVKILSIDDAEFLKDKTANSNVLSITQSIRKCQYVLYAEQLTPALKKLTSYFMEYAKVISV